MITKENSLFYKRTLLEITANTRENTKYIRPLCTVHRSPLDPTKLTDEAMYTSGLYTVSLRPLYKNFGDPASKPFLIKSDMFRIRAMRVGSWREFSDGRFDAFQWLVENTTVSEALFDLARENPLVDIPFCVDFAKYCAGRSRRLKLGEGFDKL